MRKKMYRIAGILFVAVFTLSIAAPLFAQKVSMLEAEKKLSTLGYWITKVDGRADASTRYSITAFQKVEGLKRTGVLNTAVMKALRAADKPTPKYTDGPHIEVDVERQVLFVVNDEGVVTFILPVSTGNEQKYFDEGMWQIAHTPRGDFHVYNKINGVRKASLGDLYYPSYFYGGIALHGSNSIPVKPASHGCVRVPRTADQKLFKMTPVGMPVYVYD
jgi:L,D-transpeptidase-like protein/putative peptidoglycan binding protein